MGTARGRGEGLGRRDGEDGLSLWLLSGRRPRRLERLACLVFRRSDRHEDAAAERCGTRLARDLLQGCTCQDCGDDSGIAAAALSAVCQTAIGASRTTRTL